ncbi:hypothetical protein JNW87_26450, partial [Micromonospora sp. ATA51]|nr:hypothetical protein [Micromonospora sp. ATA51]
MEAVRTRSPWLLAVLLAALAVVAQALLVPLFAAPPGPPGGRATCRSPSAGPAAATAELAGRVAAA